MDRNDPNSGLASLNHTANLSDLVLGCIDAGFAQHYRTLHRYDSGEFGGRGGEVRFMNMWQTVQIWLACK